MLFSGTKACHPELHDDNLRCKDDNTGYQKFNLPI